MGIDRMSSSQVSRICESLDVIVADLQARDLSEVAYPYVWLDATYVKCRDGGHVSSCALVTAIALVPMATEGSWGSTPSTRNPMRVGFPF